MGPVDTELPVPSEVLKKTSKRCEDRGGSVMAPIFQPHRNQALPGNFGDSNHLLGPQRSLRALQLGLLMAQSIWIISIFRSQRQLRSFLAEQGRASHCSMFCTNPRQRHGPPLQRSYLLNSCIQVPESKAVCMNFCFYF